MGFVLIDGSGKNKRYVVVVDGDEGGERVDDAAEEEGKDVRLFGGEGVKRVNHDQTFFDAVLEHVSVLAWCKHCTYSGSLLQCPWVFGC